MTDNEIQHEYLAVVRALIANPIYEDTNCEVTLNTILEHARTIIKSAQVIHIQPTITESRVKDIVAEQIANSNMLVDEAETYDVISYSNTEENTTSTMDSIEETSIRNALIRCCNNKSKAAKMLGISVRTIYRKVKEYGIKIGDL